MNKSNEKIAKAILMEPNNWIPMVDSIYFPLISNALFGGKKHLKITKQDYETLCDLMLEQISKDLHREPQKELFKHNNSQGYKLLEEIFFEKTQIDISSKYFTELNKTFLVPNVSRVTIALNLISSSPGDIMKLYALLRSLIGGGY